MQNRFFYGFSHLGYDSGKIVLIDVENHHILYTQELGTEITHLSWTQCTSDSYDDFDEVQGNTKLVRCFLL